MAPVSGETRRGKHFSGGLFNLISNHVSSPVSETRVSVPCVSCRCHVLNLKKNESERRWELYRSARSKGERNVDAAREREIHFAFLRISSSMAEETNDRKRWTWVEMGSSGSRAGSNLLNVSYKPTCVRDFRLNDYTFKRTEARSQSAKRVSSSVRNSRNESLDTSNSIRDSQVAYWTWSHP